ncbi:MAG: hypothetical protein RIC95_06685 [Vicingaceae bacterium]
MKSKVLIPLIPLFAFAILFISNPSQNSYQERLAKDFGQSHAGAKFSLLDLNKMGHSKHQSFLLFSTYQYEFGTIGVRYWGILGQTFFAGSYRKTEIEKTENTEFEQV